MDVEIATRDLVLGLARSDGAIDAGELYDVAGALGMTDQQVRLCLKRMAAQRQLTHDGRGRRATIRLAGAAARALHPDVEFVRHAYAQDHGTQPWDGTWRLVGFAVPETARAARDAFRDALTRLGGAAVQGGLYVAANDWDELVLAEAARLGVAAGVTLASSRDLAVGGIREPRALAARLWDLDAIAARWQRVAEVATARLERLGPELGRPERLTIALELATAFTQAIEPDPLLPPQLLPDPWVGGAARALLARCWARLGDAGAVGVFRMYDVVMGAASAGSGASDRHR